MAARMPAQTRSRTLQLLLPLSCLIAAGCGEPSGPTPAAEDEFTVLSSTKALTLTASVSPTTVSAGGQVALTAQITSTRATTIDVVVVVTKSSGAVSYTSSDINAHPITPTTPFLFQQAMPTSATDPSGTWNMSVTVRHSATSKVLISSEQAAVFTVTGGTTPGGGGGGGSGGTGACAGNAVFCDDFTSASLGSSYTTSSRGSWVRGAGSYTATDEAAAWERTRALLSGDDTDFDVTVQGKSMGAAGFGLSYAAQATDDDGFAVIIHPVPTLSDKPQAVYLKRLVPNAQDVELASSPLPAAVPGTLMTLRVRRVGTMVTVWLDGQQIISQDDGGTGRHGRLGLLLSITDQLSGSGAVFTLLRLDSASRVNGSDTQAPTAPKSLTAMASGSATVNLSWSAASDNVGVASYGIYRNGTKVGDSSRLTFQDTGLSASTTYTYEVDAADAAGNRSAKSSGASATTAAGASGPPQTDGSYDVKSLTYAFGELHGMKLYVPNGTGPFPILIYIHGGGWGWFPTDPDEGPPIAKREAARGYAVAIIEYRLIPDAIFPAQIQDVKAAVRWLRAHAADYDLDAGRVAAWGESAGAHLAALLGTSGGVAALEDLSQGNSQQSSTIQAVVDWFGPTNFLMINDELDQQGCDSQSQTHDDASSPESLLVGCAIQSCPAKADAASPLTYIDSKDPPFMIMHGTQDCTVPTEQSRLLDDALRARGVTSTLEIVSGMGHDDSMMLDSEESMQEIDGFLDRSLYP